MKHTDRMLVAVIGGPGSGKTTLCDYLFERRRFWPFSISDTIKIVAVSNGVNIDDFESLHRFVDSFRALQGRGVFADYTLRIMLQHAWTRALIDGGRSKETITLLRRRSEDNGWKFVALGLRTPTSVAFERIRAREGKRDTKEDGLLATYILENDKIVLPALAVCDNVIVNDSDTPTLFAAVDDILDLSIGSGY